MPTSGCSHVMSQFCPEVNFFVCRTISSSGARFTVQARVASSAWMRLRSSGRQWWAYLIDEQESIQRCIRRGLEPDIGVPEHRFVLLHSLSHLLVNELALEAGYSTASIRERLYARSPKHPSGPMAGILLYTAEPDAEGTLGGMVNLGSDVNFGRIIDEALRRGQFCSTDPFCSEHHPEDRDGSLHGAACHSCLFLPETSCGTSNRYLERATVVPTFACDDLAFFPWTP